MTISCGHIAVDVTDEQMKELEYLARWRADLAYIMERFGPDEPEAQVSRKTIEYSFTMLDKKSVPYWLQNVALAYGEDWRNRERESFTSFLKRKGYGVA